MWVIQATLARVRSEADNLFGCYGTLVSTYKGVWRSHARCERVIQATLATLATPEIGKR